MKIKKRTCMLLLSAFMTAMGLDVFSQGSVHTCGAGNIHNPAITYGQVRDIDGNSYKTVVIDDKVWFAENLRVTHFQNGDVIPNVSDSAAWSVLTGPGMCSYRNDPGFDCPQGKLYNFFAAADLRNPCPAGWRVPSMSDLYDLIFHLDPNASPEQPGNRPNSAGGKLKSTGLTYWRAPNTNATNLSGFSATPGGGRNDAGRFSLSSNAAASYWLSTPAAPDMRMGFFLELAYPQDYAVRNAYFSKYGVCIRCVADLGTVDANKTAFIYPNPNRGAFTVRLPGEFSTGSYLVTLYDSKGAKVFAQSKAFANREANFDLRKLSTGIYMLRVWNLAGKEIRTGKVAIL